MNDTVFITGASRGIGRACALTFARAGFRVGVGYCRSEDAALSLIREIADMGGMAQAVRGDTASRDDAFRMTQEIKTSLGHIDVLVNNAGIALTGAFDTASEADMRRLFDVNVFGSFNCAQAVLPDMIKNKRGAIISISSMWGVTGGSCEVAYSASKAALIGFTRALAKEVGPSGIRVNCVAPGVIDTDMNAALSAADREALLFDTPLMRIGTPAEVADCVLFLAGEGASFITGQVLSPNGGFVI